jgi:hypothetical protein
MGEYEMAEKLYAWQIGPDGKPFAIANVWPTLEARLEDWIENDVTLADQGLLYLGRQLTTDLGTALDVLAIEASGRLSVLELKRERSPREMVAQALEYAAWVATLSPDDVISCGVAAYGSLEQFRARFESKFGIEFPPVEDINREQRILLVAPEFSETVARTARYLSSRFGVPIKAVSFGLFQVGDSRILVRSDVIDENLDGVKSGASRAKRTIEELRELADERGTLDIVDELLTLRTRVLTSVETTQTTISLRRNAGSGRYLSGISIHPGADGQHGALVNVSRQNLAALFGAASDSVLTELDRYEPPVNNPWGKGWDGWTQVVIPTRVDVSRLVEVYRTALDSATAGGAVGPADPNDP